jgi:DNA-binding transcriptional ArsR family regulator
MNPNVAKAVSHPPRMRILMILHKGVASPSELATELGEPLNLVSYHVKRLEALKCAELVRTEARRGAADGGFDRDGAHASNSQLELDEEGWTELAGVLEQALSRFLDIQADATNRVAAGPDGDGNSATFQANVSLMLFEKPQRGRASQRCAARCASAPSTSSSFRSGASTPRSTRSCRRSTTSTSAARCSPRATAAPCGWRGAVRSSAASPRTSSRPASRASRVRGVMDRWSGVFDLSYTALD